MPLLFQISYPLVPKIEICMKYFSDKKFPKPAIVESKKLRDSDSVHFLRIGCKLKNASEITRSLANPADATLFSFFPTTHFHQKVLHILILQCFIQCHLVLFYLMQTSLCPLFRNIVKSRVLTRLV